MFSTQKRVTATLLIFGFLVVSFGMFATPAFGSCQFYKSWCCSALETTQTMCNWYGTDSWQCRDWIAYTSSICALANSECGYIVAHDCFGG